MIWDDFAKLPFAGGYLGTAAQKADFSDRRKTPVMSKHEPNGQNAPGTPNHRTRKLPHSIIVKAPGLLPMLYKPSELADDLDIPERTLRDWLDDGAPHSRDNRKHIWINGEEFAQWVETERKPKKERKMEVGQAYCFHCKQIVDMVDPSVSYTKGKLALQTGKCPLCHGKINRGGNCG